MKTLTKTTKMTRIENAPRVTFSCASQKDHNKVTVSLFELARAVGGMDRPDKGDRFIIELVSSRSRTPVAVVFTANRNDTAATNGWPHRFIMPRVGDPVYIRVERVQSLPTSALTESPDL
jgi:hypothetical protein